tara:strand:+ start:8302 stop:8535 length:234 start_codon:yes stop_codon:yes gene_type:complete
MAYLQDRRYRIVGGKLEKNFDGDQEGWFKSKADARDAVKKPKPKRKRNPTRKKPAGKISDVVAIPGANKPARKANTK